MMNIFTRAGESDCESVGTDGVADEENYDQGWITTTRSGQCSRPPASYREEISSAVLVMAMPETNYYQMLYEENNDDDYNDVVVVVCIDQMECVGAGLGGGS